MMVKLFQLKFWKRLEKWLMELDALKEYWKYLKYYIILI